MAAGFQRHAEESRICPQHLGRGTVHRHAPTSRIRQLHHQHAAAGGGDFSTQAVGAKGHILQVFGPKVFRTGRNGIQLLAFHRQAVKLVIARKGQYNRDLLQGFITGAKVIHKVMPAAVILAVGAVILNAALTNVAEQAQIDTVLAPEMRILLLQAAAVMGAYGAQFFFAHRIQRAGGRVLHALHHKGGLTIRHRLGNGQGNAPAVLRGIVGGFIQLLHAVQLHFSCGAYRIAGQFRFGQQAGFFQHYAVQQGILLLQRGQGVIGFAADLVLRRIADGQRRRIGVNRNRAAADFRCLHGLAVK